MYNDTCTHHRSDIKPSDGLIAEINIYIIALAFATGVAGYMGRSLLQTPCHVPFWTCICSACCDQYFCQACTDLPDCAPGTSQCTFFNLTSPVYFKVYCN